MFKNLLKKWASDIVLDALLAVAAKKLLDAKTEASIQKWTTIREFIVEMKIHGLP